MSTSAWKPPRLIQTEPSEKKSEPQKFKVTYLRAATIGPSNIGATVHVHNGHRFVPVKLTDGMVGYKLGQFALTKKRVLHKKKKSNR